MGVEDPLGPEGADSSMPKLLATSLQALQCTAMPNDIPTTVPISHPTSPPLHQKLQLWPAFPPLYSLGLTLGLTQAPCQRRYSNYKGKWMWPWGSCSQLRLLWTPAKEGWYLILKLPCIKMRPRLPRPPKRQRPTAQPWSGIQRLCAQLPPGR